VPFVDMNAASVSLTRASPYLVRVSFTLWQEAYPFGKWAAQHGEKRAYIAVSDYAPGHDAEAGFTKGFTEAGGQIVGTVRFPLKSPDFVPFMQRVRDAKPEAVFIFVPSGTQATEIMKALGAVGLRDKVKVLSTQDLVPEEELPNMGDLPLGIVTAGTYSTAAKRPANEAFLAAWKREYGTKAIPDFMSVGGWDGMAAIFDVIKQTKGKFTGEQAMEILSHWKNPNSPRGPISIDPETRDIVQNVYIRRTEKVNGHLANVEFDTIPNVKDPWKEFNPPKK
jgi:branched-chain amino acid transport system substrate-binding protein